LAIAADAASFLVSAVSLAAMRVHEPAKAPVQRDLWGEVRHALELIECDPVLRVVVVASAAFNLFAIMRTALFVLAVTRELHLSPATLGLAVAASGPSSIVASVAAAHVTPFLGTELAIVVGLGMVALSFGSVPIAALDLAYAVPILVGGQALLGAGLALSHVPFGVLVQTRVPTDSLGRVWATLRTLFDCAIPVGALIGGALGTTIGVVSTQTVATLGCLAAVAFLAAALGRK
jgi:predicted MFS family arabinose efflux permease